MHSEVLQSVRPFKMGDITLSDIDELDPNDPKVMEKITEILATRVNRLIDEAKDELRKSQVYTRKEVDSTEILVRLRVEHTGFQVISNQRFGGQFVGKVANPGDILLFSRRKKLFNEGEKKETGGLLDPIRPPPLDSSIRVENILAEQLRNPDKKLNIFAEATMAHALEDYVFKNVPSALEEYVEKVVKETQGALKNNKSTASEKEIQDIVEKNIDRVRASHLVRAAEANPLDPSQASQRTTTSSAGDILPNLNPNISTSDINLSSTQRKKPTSLALGSNERYLSRTKITNPTPLSDEGSAYSGEEVASRSRNVVSKSRAIGKRKALPKSKAFPSQDAESDSEQDVDQLKSSRTRISRATGKSPAQAKRASSKKTAVINILSGSEDEVHEPVLKKKRSSKAKEKKPAITSTAYSARSLSKKGSQATSSNSNQRSIADMFSQQSQTLDHSKKFPAARGTDKFPDEIASSSDDESKFGAGVTQNTQYGGTKLSMSNTKPTPSGTTRRKLPLSLASYTQDDVDSQASIRVPSSKGWGQSRF